MPSDYLFIGRRVSAGSIPKRKHPVSPGSFSGPAERAEPKASCNLLQSDSRWEPVAHGAISGVILFFTCVSAVVAPLAMGLIGEYADDGIYGFYLATAFAAVLAAGLVLNMIFDPANAELRRRGEIDY